MFFEELVKRLSPTLKRIIYKLNGHPTFLNDEDLYQEALIHLWQDFRVGKLDNKTDSYILQGCYFYLKNYLRKVNEKLLLVSFDAIVDEGKVSFGETFFLKDKNVQNSLNSLNNEMLLEILYNNGLNKREKDILFFYAEGLTTREIGKRMGISHVRVVKLMSRIRNKCRKYMGDY
ncbi:MAG: sigma-70 family RNA polymerase sigma factor [Candidatus Omnitrophica bacterium]|nr:sigma-70 family RNA polymerase sigma factor [Candidatus Omnitrophota bacterium]